MVYLVMAGISGIIFVLCSFWIYHYVEVDGQILVDEGDDEKADCETYSTGMSIDASV